MARLPVFLGVVALNLMHPAATLAAPTGGGVHHAASAPARSSASGRSAGSESGNFKVPFDVDVRPRPLPGTEALPQERLPAWWRPSQLWYFNPCLGSGASWGAPGLQATWTDELTLPGFTIGSLAGDPSNSLLSSSSSHNASIASSIDSGLGSGSPLSFQYGPPATRCGAPGLPF